MAGSGVNHQIAQARSGLGTQPPFLWKWLGGATKVTDTSRNANDAAASQAMNPEPITTAEAAVSAALRSAVASASERSNSARRPPGTGGGPGAAPHARIKVSNTCRRSPV